MGAGGKNGQTKSDLEETLSRLASQTPIVEGPMYKQYRSGVGFNKRYFALYDGVLVYYHHQRAYQKEKSSGTIKTCKILKLDGLYLSSPDSTPNRLAKKQHAFKLHVPDTFNKRREILLVATCKKSKHIWMEMLQQQNPALLPPVNESLKPTPPYITRIRSCLHTYDTVPAGCLLCADDGTHTGGKVRPLSLRRRASAPPISQRAKATAEHTPLHHRPSV